MTCQRVIIINEGKVIAVDTPQNLTSNIQGAGRIVVKVDGPWQEVVKGLSGITGISRVDRKEGGNGISEFVIDTAKGLDVRKEIAPLIVKNGWGLLELKPVEMSLEDIFVKLVTKE